MPTITLPSGTVHFSEHGQGAPMVLLHANPGDSRDFAAVIPGLAKNYRVIALDWPGYGQSALPKRPEAVGVLFFYQVLQEFLTALSLPAAYFIGNSLGGNAAARLAVESSERVRALILVAPGGFTSPNFITRSFCRLQGSRWSLSPYRFARFYLKQRTPTTHAMLERASSVQAEPPQIALNRAVWRDFARPNNDLRSMANKIKAPTLLLFGSRDPVIPAHKDGKTAEQCMPHAKCVTLPCGHASFAEVPELFLAELEPFLTGN